MSQLQAILESEDCQEFLTDNEEILDEVAEDVVGFSSVMKAFILEHADEFLDNTLEDTYKNIRIFSEFATHQFIGEMCAAKASMIAESIGSFDGVSGYSEEEEDYI